MPSNGFSRFAGYPRVRYCAPCVQGLLATHESTHFLAQIAKHRRMTETRLSCGLLVLNEADELLVGHSTGNFIWDLPKGLIDQGEDAPTCALREFF